MMIKIQMIWHHVTTKVAIFILSIACPLMLGIAPKFKAKNLESEKMKTYEGKWLEMCKSLDEKELEKLCKMVGIEGGRA